MVQSYAPRARRPALPTSVGYYAAVLYAWGTRPIAR
jgi:hypothetical protein